MGTFNISTNIDDAIMQLSINNKVISLSESDPDLINLGAMPATILLPPVEAIMEFIDGNVDVAAAIYDSYLLQPEVESYLCALYTSIRFTANNILLYIGKDEAEVGLVNHLIQHFTQHFVMPFNGYYAFMDIGLYRSYLYDLVSFEQLVLNLQNTTTYPVEVNVIPKLANDLQFFRSPEDIANEFLKYAASCQRQGRLLERMCCFK